MMTTRSKQRKVDNDDSLSWPSLSDELLLLIMMQVGFFDFIALSGVCKSWRSIAISNWSQVVKSKQPIRLSLSDRISDKECYLEENNTIRKMNTIPHSRGRVCVGLTCGYLIFYGRKTHDFWLVNPITRKELHFPGFTVSASAIPTSIRGILVYSPSMNAWVFVVLTYRFSSELFFSLSGKQAKWRSISCNSIIVDVHFFKGKIYTLNSLNHLYELRLSQVPTFTLHKMKNSPWSNFRYNKLVSSSEKIYAMDDSGDFDAIEANLDEREWMNFERTIGEYAVFVSDLKSDAALKPDTWVHPWTRYERLNYADDHDQIQFMGRSLTTYMWYFPHDCLNDTKNGDLVNILEE